LRFQTAEETAHIDFIIYVRPRWVLDTALAASYSFLIYFGVVSYSDIIIHMLSR